MLGAASAPPRLFPALRAVLTRGSDQAALAPQPRPPRRPAAPPRVLEELLAHADVRLNGPRPWDIRVRDPRLYQRVLARWSLGLGESYMDGDWDCERLDELFHRLLRSDIESRARGLARLRRGLESLRQTIRAAVLLVSAVDTAPEPPRWKRRLTFPVEP